MPNMLLDNPYVEQAIVVYEILDARCQTGTFNDKGVRSGLLVTDLPKIEVTSTDPEEAERQRRGQQDRVASDLFALAFAFSRDETHRSDIIASIATYLNMEIDTVEEVVEATFDNPRSAENKSSYLDLLSALGETTLRESA